MEALLVVSHHRNNHQYYGKNRGHGSSKFGAFGSMAAGHFQGINCRTFQPGAGLLPTPMKSCSAITPVIRRAFSSSFSPKTPSPSGLGNQKSSKRNAKSFSIPIPINIKFDIYEKQINDDFHFSERWAGPAYSNSPPPSSLPMPKFSLQPRRTISQDFTTSPSDIGLHFMSKSAPASPDREHNPYPSDLFNSSDSATKTLRRILNLDITDE